jgi:hypothetical protein
MDYFQYSHALIAVEVDGKDALVKLMPTVGTKWIGSNNTFLPLTTYLNHYFIIKLCVRIRILFLLPKT